MLHLLKSNYLQSKYTVLTTVLLATIVLAILAPCRIRHHALISPIIASQSHSRLGIRAAIYVGFGVSRLIGESLKHYTSPKKWLETSFTSASQESEESI